MKHKQMVRILVWIVGISMVLASSGWAGNKKIMSIRAAKVLAERALVESMYGLKLRAAEEVQDLVASSFVGSTESKTSATISGIKFEEVVYDPDRDIAKVTASASMSSITNIDGDTIDLQGKIFRRVAFATSTPSNAGALRAMRAAELDAYQQLVKQIVGFTLESQTSVENYMLKSDLVKTKVLATMYMAEVTEYGWDENGDAFVKMVLDMADIGNMLGEAVVSGEQAIEVEGMGAATDDFSSAKTGQK